MLAGLPVRRKWTLYGATGDVVPYLAIIFVVIVAVVGIRNRPS
jgi:hypothetical protein